MEIGLSFPDIEMDAFATIFVDGLETLWNPSSTGAWAKALSAATIGHLSHPSPDQLPAITGNPAPLELGSRLSLLPLSGQSRNPRTPSGH
ncbi:hypothetical protein RJ639_011444 [Escallonia herrerae]|uniref:Uncharacterized protein n=1 Tax=Escallonia herrerae TaxID=1293975 RepID=A0AA88VK98_9ASTE|nr:hypothetical protein RJ639_011444 [Escallonia herrerae]